MANSDKAPDREKNQVQFDSLNMDIFEPTDVVVEANIVRAVAAPRDVALARPAAAEPLPRAIPLPDNGNGHAIVHLIPRIPGKTLNALLFFVAFPFVAF